MKRTIFYSASVVLVVAAIAITVGLGNVSGLGLAGQWGGIGAPSQGANSGIEPEGAVVSAAPQGTSTAVVGGAGAQPDYEQGAVLVELKEGTTADELNNCLGLLSYVATKKVTEEDIAFGYVKLRLAQGVEVGEAQRRLVNESIIEAAQPNYVYHLVESSSTEQQSTASRAEMQYSTVESVALEEQSTAVNDPKATEQWGLDAVHAYDAWDTAKVEGAVTVAVLDSGLDVKHADFDSTRIVAPRSFTGSKVSSDVTDKRGHGTRVAGIIAATTNNATGVAGVSYNANIMPVQVIDPNGDTDSTTIAKALNYVVQNAATYKVKVANISIGSKGNFAGSRDASYDKAIAAVHKAGILVVYAAGNYADTEGGAYNSYPCDYDMAEESIGVIGVNKSGESYARASFSNYNKNNQVTKELSAPGCGIYSTLVGGGYGYDTSDKGNGTSFAAPFVTGIAALVFANNNSLTPAQVRNALCNTAQDLGASGWDNETGYGIVDAKAAVENTKKGAATNVTNRPSSEIISLKAARMLVLKTSYTYTGKPFTPNVELELNGITLIPNVDYTLAYKNNKNAGTGIVTATGKGGFKGSISKTFTIKRVPLSSMKLSTAKYSFNGKAHSPKVVVYGVKNGASERVLNAGTDYTLSVPEGRKAVGSYTYVARGEGNYSGTVKATLKVVKAKNSMIVSGSPAIAKASKLKKASKTVKAVKVKNARGTVTYKKRSGSGLLKVDKKTGKITVKKGTPKGVYKAKITVKASGNESYKALSKTITVKVTVK